MTVAILNPLEAKTRVRGVAEFRLEWFSGTGKGGQHRNKHQNCLRLICPRTGIIQTATGREREGNLRNALAEMNRRLNEAEFQGLAQGQNSSRRQQVGSGMRGDKRRTYRFRDDWVRDDITGKEARASQVMRGRFDPLW